jgi:ABC-type sugar transport system ATPase subunit
VAVLRDGRLVQFDAPKTVYRRPASRFVAEFMGRPAMNTFEGRVDDGTFRADGLSFAVRDIADGPVVLGIRPEQVKLVDGSATDAVAATVDVVELAEPDMLVFARNGNSSVVVRTPSSDRLFAHGDPLLLHFPPEALHAFDAVTGTRLP